MTNISRSLIAHVMVLVFISTPVFSGSDHHDHHDNEQPEQTQLSQQQIKASGLRTTRASQKTIERTDRLFGVIETDKNKVFQVHAPYLSLVEKVHVRLGEKVKKGMTLLTLVNIKTLRKYTVKSVANGVVTKRMTNPGDRANEQALLEVTDLSEVWVDMSAFPESLEKLKVGQKVTVYNIHQNLKIGSQISYIAPLMTGGHIARARAVIDNTEGHWRPGMHIKADITIESRTVPVAVKLQAIQTYMNKPTVFVQQANNFKPRHIKLGIQDDEFVEVLSGLQVGESYVSNNSFLIKADLLKGSASHDH